MKYYYAYMLLCSDGSFYVSITNDIELRVGQHEYGHDPHCYTYERRPVRLVYSANFTDVKDAKDAIDCEKRIKGWSRAKKRALIANDWAGM